MKKISVLWDDEVNGEEGRPFREDIDHMNSSYAIFSEIAEERGGKVFIANFNWIEDTGLRKGFTYRDGGWREVEDVELDVVFDKFKFDDETVPLKKKLNRALPVLNRFDLEEICKDKLLTYQEFPGIIPETKKADRKTVKDMLEKYDRVIVKPRYDFGGKGIEVIEDISEFEPEEDLLVQRFIETEGIEELGIEGVHDLRVYVLNGENTLAYIRTPDEGLLSNVHLGGEITFVDLEEVPETALDTVQGVKEKFSKYEPCLYSVDMMIDSDGKPWVLEFNSKPGLAFYEDEEIKKRKLPTVEGLVETLVSMG